MPSMVYRAVWFYILCVAGCGRLHLDAELDHRPSLTLTIDGSTITEELIEFPLLVRLDDDHLDRSVMLEDGSDLRFYVEGSREPLPFEIETLEGGPSGTEVVAWVQVPRVASGDITTLRVSYGDSTVQRATGVVWSASYAAVLHLGEASGTPTDATGRYETIRSANASPAPGSIGRGRPFSAASKMAFRMSTGAVEPMPATASGWMNLSTVSPGAISYHALVAQESENSGDNVVFLGLRDTHFYVHFRCLTPEGPSGIQVDTKDLTASPSQSATIGQWIHLAATFTRNADGTNHVTLFVDGQMVKRSDAVACEPAAGSVNPITVGADVNGCASGIDCPPDNDWFDGVLDEMRIENVSRSPGWMRIDYLSMTNQLITYGPIGRVDA